MKKIFALSVVLAAAMVISAAAQQDSQQNSKDAQQAPAATAQTSDQQQTQSATDGREPLKYEQHEGFWGHLNPFARKKYVNKQMDPIRGRVNELDELTSKNSRMIADVDSRATAGIRNAMSKADEADQHAIEANNRANLAHQTATQASARITNVESVVSKIDQFQPVTQAEIHFQPGQSALSKNAKDALDQIATTLKDQKGYIIEVQGFSSGRGSAAIENSRQMAQMVVRYLVLNHEIPVYRIYTVGMGNAAIQAEGKTVRTRGGRVELSLLKNGLGDLNGTPSASGAAAPNSETKQQ